MGKETEVTKLSHSGIRADSIFVQDLFRGEPKLRQDRDDVKDQNIRKEMTCPEEEKGWR